MWCRFKIQIWSGSAQKSCFFLMPERVRFCTYGCGHSKKRWDIQFPSYGLFNSSSLNHKRRVPTWTCSHTWNASQFSLSGGELEDLIISSVMMVLFNMRRVNFNISVARKPSVFPKMQELLPLIGRQLQKVTSGVWIDNVSKDWVEFTRSPGELQLWEQG